MGKYFIGYIASLGKAQPAVPHGAVILNMIFSLNGTAT
jgi:hypothetical protein